MKRRATGLLLAAVVIFIVARALESDADGWGYLRATAEAAMIGGLADWFAVTALFRHPLGLPIPHTAIIKRRKDDLGRSLGSFVRDNFLSSELIEQRVASAEVGRRFGSWLAQPANARRVGDQAATAVGGVSEVLRDEDVQAALDDLITERIRRTDLTPILGRVVEVAVERGHHQDIFDVMMTATARFLSDNRAMLRSRLDQESPWWVPEPLDDRVFNKLYGGIQRFIADVGGDPHHELRRELDVRAADLGRRLRHDPQLAARGEEMKEEFLTHPEFRVWTARLGADLKQAALDAVEDPESDLRTRFEAFLTDFGARLRDEPELQAKFDRWIATAAAYIGAQARPEMANLIATTVENWDPEETSLRIEHQVGRDLQFIRINGTLVGGLAGLAIYTLSELAF